MRHKSITLRLTLLFAAASAAVLVAVGAVIGFAVGAHFEELDFDELQGKVELVRHIVARMHSRADLDALPQHLDDALVGHHNLSMVVIAPDRRMLFTTPGASFPRSLFDSHSTVGAAGLEQLRIWKDGGQTYRGVCVAIPTHIPDTAPFTVALALNIAQHREFMATFQQTLWASIVLGIAVTGLLGWVVARRGLAPVRNIAQIAKGITANRLNDRLPVDSAPTELVDLAASFNAMLSRLENAFKRLSDFSSDLAHELRTPISNLMTQTQVALSKTRTAEEYREILHSNLEEFDYLARMTSDMLFLAKADHGLIVPRSEAVDLEREVQHLFEFYEALAEEQGVKLACSGQGIALGDKLMLRRALSNLISNAIRHTQRDGAVGIRIHRDGGGMTTVAVENPGEDIPPQHLALLFDRFYRIDSSRQRSSDGAGLGLAIAKSIVETHGGTLTVASANGITRFDMSLPAA